MNNSEIKALISLLDDGDADVQAHVEQKILSMGDGIIPFLEDAWENDFNPIVQKKIEELIHTLQTGLLKSRLANWKENNQEDLLEGMWIIATYLYPDLELQKLREQIEQLYYEVWVDFKPDLHPFEQIKLINSALFGKLKFSANTKNFHSPSNSMINVVLESKKGNPISLCVVYMLITKKLGLPVYGVNLPNLFILTYKMDDLQFYVNAFNKGLIFMKTDIDNYVTHLKLAPNEIFYQPCDNLHIIQRVLRNLMVAYDRMGEPERTEELDQLLKMLGEGPQV